MFDCVCCAGDPVRPHLERHAERAPLLVCSGAHGATAPDPHRLHPRVPEVTHQQQTSINYRRQLERGETMAEVNARVITHRVHTLS